MKLKQLLLRNWIQKLVSLVFAVGLFFYVSKQKTADRVFQVPLRIKNQPGFLIPIKPLPRTIPVKVTGQLRRIVLVEARQITAVVDMSSATRGANTFYISLNYSGLSEDVNLSIGSRTLTVEMDLLREKYLTVKPQLVGKPAAGWAVSETEVKPPRVLVSGPLSVLKTLDELQLRPVNINGVRSDIERVVEPEFDGLNLNLKQQPRIMLIIRVKMERAQRTFKDLVVRVEGLPDGRQVVDETRVSVWLTGYKNELRSLRPAALDPLVRLPAGAAAGRYRLAVQLEAPAGFIVDKIVPKQVTIVIR